MSNTARGDNNLPFGTESQVPKRRMRGCLIGCLGVLCLLVSPLLLLQWHQYRQSSDWLIRWLPRDQRQAIEELRKSGNQIHAHVSYETAGNPTRLNLQLRGKPTADLRRALAKLKAINSIEAVSDVTGWISELPEMPTVESLQLSDSDVADDDLQVLERLPHLTALLLSKTKITPAAIEHFKHLPQLKFLHLNDTQISGGLEPISRLNHLRYLFLLNTNLVDSDIPHVCRPSLEELFVTGAQITSEGFAPMPKLRSLVANNTQIDDAMFEILAHSPSLSTLHLSGTRVTGKGFEKLPNLWLSSVMLDDTTVDDAVCEVLAQARELSYLSLRRTRITTDGIRTLSVCPRLNQLNISRSATQPDPDLLNLLRAKTPLRCNVYVDPNETPQKTDQPPS